MRNIKSSLRCRGALVMLGAVAALLTSSASAYYAEGETWTLNRTVVMHLSFATEVSPLRDGFKSFNESAADALNAWNQYLAHLKFRPVLASSLPRGDSDADTSVFFSDTVYGDAFGSRVLAVTLVITRDSTILETDVLFNLKESWDSYSGPRSGAYDFHRVALHEFGHVLGLGHPDQHKQQVTAIMNSTVSGIDTLQQDDISGARALYNVGPPYLSSVAAPALVNLSTRARVGTGANVLIGGFIVQGSQPATIVLRGIGHSLAANGISKPLTDPVIDLRNSAGVLVASSDDWIDGPDATTIASYGLDPTNSRESAILKTLSPGSYTVELHAFDNEDGDLTGTGVVELYDLHTTAGRAGNISSRGEILGGDDIMVAGFIIGGTNRKELVVRGIGPSLSDAGITNSLADPRLELRDASGTLVRQNNDWAADPEAEAVQSSGLAPKSSKESALHVTLNAGLYTALLSGVNNTRGIALVEVYDLSPSP